MSCEDCKYFRRFTSVTWQGVCNNERKIVHDKEGGNCKYWKWKEKEGEPK